MEILVSVVKVQSFSYFVCVLCLIGHENVLLTDWYIDI